MKPGSCPWYTKNEFLSFTMAKSPDSQPTSSFQKETAFLVFSLNTLQRCGLLVIMWNPSRHFILLQWDPWNSRWSPHSCSHKIVHSRFRMRIGALPRYGLLFDLGGRLRPSGKDTEEWEPKAFGKMPCFSFFSIFRFGLKTCGFEICCNMLFVWSIKFLKKCLENMQRCNLMFLNFGNCNKRIIRYFTTTYHDIDQHCFPTHFPQISMVRIQMGEARLTQRVSGAKITMRHVSSFRESFITTIPCISLNGGSWWRVTPRDSSRNLRWQKNMVGNFLDNHQAKWVGDWMILYISVQIFSLWKHLLTIACLAYYSLWQACVEESPWSSPGCALISPVTGKM